MMIPFINVEHENNLLIGTSHCPVRSLEEFTATTGGLVFVVNHQGWRHLQRMHSFGTSMHTVQCCFVWPLVFCRALFGIETGSIMGRMS
jgi:hypothetical protein